MSTVLLVSVSSAALFALGNSLQHLVASSMPSEGLPLSRLAWTLARHRTWLLGAGISGAAFVTHILALSIGHVGVVQALLLSGVVMATLLRPLLEQKRPDGRKVLIAGATMAGLALYVIAGAIADQPPRDGLLGIQAVVLTVTAVAALALYGSRRAGRAAAFVLALTSGALMGTSAVIVKSLLVEAPTLPAVIGDWRMFGVLALGLAGTVLNQRAYNMGSITTTMPALNVASVLVGGIAGALVFGEFPRLDPLGAAGQVVGIVVIAVGLALCAGADTRRADEEDAIVNHEVVTTRGLDG